MLTKRAITSVWYVVLIIVVVWFGGEPGLTAMVAVLGVLAAFEFYHMVAASKGPPLTYFGLVWTALLILSRSSGLISLVETNFNPELITPLLLTSTLVLSLIGILVRRRKEGAFTSWVWTMAGIFYIGWLLSHLVALRGLESGRNLVFLVLFVTWVSDTTAFLVGRRFGRHKMAPAISPSKTWEGTLGGICGAVAVSILFFTPTFFQLPLGIGQVILLSVLASILGQLGDLIESLLKRNLGVKDSGRLMPGHGGVLDRIDSLILAGVVVYYYAIWVM
ncbi:MAG: phosphatidate cytidylyltransferase [Dehalococcoidales bacterium]|jgi:phosphatidate cytidylyltransferase|nr:phosphatidate cytidylyltransferase [Dehalococcoidales bacterium]